MRRKVLDEAATRRTIVRGVPPEPLIRRSRWPEALGREGLSRFGDGCLPWRSRQEPGARLSNQTRGLRRLLPTVGQRADRSSQVSRDRSTIQESMLAASLGALRRFDQGIALALFSHLAFPRGTYFL